MPDPSRRIIAFDPDSGSLPEGLLLPPDHGGEVVGVLVDPELRAWAGQALLALARGWTARGRRVTLLDADFGSPTLPPGGGAPHEGLSDLLFFGASLDRVRVVLPGEGFSLVPAGTVVPDAAEAWSHPGWDALLTVLRRQDQVALILLPGNREGTVPLASRADRLFRIGRDATTGDLRHPLLYPASDPPPMAPSSGPVPGPLSGGSSPSSFRAAPDPADVSPGWEDGRGSPEGMGEADAPLDPTPPPVDGMTRADQGSLAEKPEAQEDRIALARAEAAADHVRPGPVRTPSAPVRRRGLPWVLILLVVLVLALVAAFWLGLIPGPGPETGQRSEGGAVALAAAAVAAADAGIPGSALAPRG